MNLENITDCINIAENAGHKTEPRRAKNELMVLKETNEMLLNCIKKLDAAGSLALHTGDNGLHNFVELMLLNTKQAIKSTE